MLNIHFFSTSSAQMFALLRIEQRRRTLQAEITA
jgi:hypothetical protein